LRDPDPNQRDHQASFQAWLALPAPPRGPNSRVPLPFRLPPKVRALD
jgi:hypothetical protein